VGRQHGRVKRSGVVVGSLGGGCSRRAEIASRYHRSRGRVGKSMKQVGGETHRRSSQASAKSWHRATGWVRAGPRSIVRLRRHRHRLLLRDQPTTHAGATAAFLAAVKLTQLHRLPATELDHQNCQLCRPLTASRYRILPSKLSSALCTINSAYRTPPYLLL
jgi:hypothetical protein